MDDLADPRHPDPVIHESSRVQAAVHSNSQPGYYVARWPDYYGFDEDLVRSLMQHADSGFTQLPEDEVWGPEGEALGRVLDFVALLSPDDPPLHTICGNPDTPEDQIDSHSILVHHPRGGVALYEACVAQGLDCSVDNAVLREGFRGGPGAFLLDRLLP